MSDFYLQLTTKCNFTCDHCAFSCTMKGKHGDYHDILDAIRYASDHSDHITLGGGEPTLHPRFFDILKRTLWAFEYVFMVTNGSQTDSMRRLVKILDSEDYEDVPCTCEPDEEECYCYDNGDPDYTIQMQNEDQFAVAVSQDPFHDEIDPWVTDTWRHRNWELRDTSNRLLGQGRAKKNNIGWEEGCLGNSHVIKPNGRIKLCSCTGAPYIGHVRMGGIHEEWLNAINSSDTFNDSYCHKSMLPGEKPKGVVIYA